MDPTGFSEHELYAHLVAAQRRGTLGPAPVAEHLQHARCYVAILDHFFGPAPKRVLDLGSGAGLPGLVVFAERPDTVVLVEGSSTRAAALQELADHLASGGRLLVDARRAELAGHDRALRACFDAVVARGFAKPAVLLECAAPFLRQGGILVVSEPPVQDPKRWPKEAISVLGLEKVPTPAMPFSFAAFEQRELCADRYPRRVGVPEKRPLF